MKSENMEKILKALKRSKDAFNLSLFEFCSNYAQYDMLCERWRNKITEEEFYAIKEWLEETNDEGKND